MTEPASWFVTTFLRMWAVAHVVHLCVANDYRLDTPWNLGTVLLAGAVVLRPADGRFVAGMAVLQLADLVAEMPTSPDHWTLLGFGNLALLVCFVSQRSLSPEAVARALPALRVIVLITYSAAALAKYNSTFTDPDLSCAPAIARRASYGLVDHLHTDWLWVASVLAMETAIPLLLVLPRTRRHGVRLAFGFHFVLSASPAFGVFDFTTALYALFFLFLSDDDARAILDRIGSWSRRSAVARDARRHPLVAATTVLVVLGVSGHATPRIGGGVMYVLVEIYLATILVAGLLTWRQAAAPRRFGRFPAATTVVAALAIVWVASPYLGSRTTGVFTMFSSLRTESGQENHLFLPNVHLTDWQERLVVLKGSNDPTIDAAADRQLAVPLLQLRILASSNPDLEVSGVLDGERVVFGPGPGQRHLSEPHLLERTFLWFRPVPVGSARFCSNS